MVSNICKLLYIGDHGVGKTCTNLSIMQGSFPSEYIPTADFESWPYSETVDGCDYSIHITEAPGRDYYDDVRILGYVNPDPDAVLIVFDVANRTSFENVEQKWLPEVKHHAPYLPVILVANKIDLRSNENSDSNEQQEEEDITTDIVTTEEGQALAAKLGIPTYLECSALTQEGIPFIIPTAMPIAFQVSKVMKKYRKFSFRLKMIFTSARVLGRFLLSVVTCNCRYFVKYCSRSKCEFHHI